MDNTLNNALRNRYLAVYVIQNSISIITFDDEYSIVNFLFFNMAFLYERLKKL